MFRFTHDKILLKRTTGKSSSYFYASAFVAAPAGHDEGWFRGIFTAAHGVPALSMKSRASVLKPSFSHPEQIYAYIGKSKQVLADLSGILSKIYDSA
ncbi:hypothetical protein [Sphingobium fuliginis]|uniref:hypothetical protein n=1 Tax=Sphingobium fuliginis (strain ATCC 27551) TaxID=336203 RepID=UPI0011AECA3D|nr:hypothetical protein [Sphingobium fuliginis]